MPQTPSQETLAPQDPTPESTQTSAQSALAPIVLFTYNRPKHTKTTLEALIANDLAKDSLLFIYQDGLQNGLQDEAQNGATTEDKAPSDKRAAAQKSAQRLAHEEVRCYLESIARENESRGYFKRVELIYRSRNLGLADSIIDGVSTIINTYGKVIVLEDDIVTSPVFLSYCNAALDRYKHDKRVWAISGWNYPIDTTDLGDSFFWRVPHCWGWASWSDRWTHVHRDMEWIDKNFDENDRAYIDLDGSGRYFEHFLLNKSGKIKTWAIFNYLIAYKHNALTLMPKISYITQIGFDGSGVHCGGEGNVYNPKHINRTFPIEFPSEVKESSLALRRIQAFERAMHRPLAIRAWHKLQRIAKAQIMRWGGAAHSADSGIAPESGFCIFPPFLHPFSRPPVSLQPFLASPFLVPPLFSSPFIFLHLSSPLPARYRAPDISARDVSAQEVAQEMAWEVAQEVAWREVA